MIFLAQPRLAQVGLGWLRLVQIGSGGLRLAQIGSDWLTNVINEIFSAFLLNLGSILTLKLRRQNFCLDLNLVSSIKDFF